MSFDLICNVFNLEAVSFGFFLTRTVAMDPDYFMQVVELVVCLNLKGYNGNMFMMVFHNI